MDQVPGQLLHDLSVGEEKAVTAWWAGLSDLDRSEVAALCDARRDACFFGAVPEDASASVPVVIGGRFVASDEAAGWAEWHAELFDYLLCNPELVFVQPPVLRTFHICTRHEAARAILAAGTIPADFQCPLNSADCLMRRLLNVAPARDLPR